MKCAACKYEYDHSTDWDAEPVINIKTKKKEHPNLNIGDKNFIESGLNAAWQDHRAWETRMESIYICPKCGTLKVNLE